MDNQEQIGLIAWGLKLGKQVFFHSNFINPEEPAMVNALEDIRGVVNFTQPNLHFYSLEFTERYRIYTAYRTIFDWVGREGYLALSVLVPHKLQLKEAHTFRLLKDLVSAYETEYIDERHRIKNQRENPDLFFKLINTERLQPMTHRETLSGNANNRYAYQPFRSEADLADYFDSPYRREFIGFKEVFFLPQSEPRLRPSENATKLDLPPKVISYTLDIAFQDEKGDKIQPDNWSAQVENKQYKTLTISDLNLNDQISIYAEKAGYNTIYQTIPLNTQFWGHDTRKGKVITFSKKQVTVSVCFLNKENHPLKGVLLSISINKEPEPPSKFQVNERYDFKAYIDDSITLIARKDNASQEDNFKVESFFIKNDICERRLCLADPTSFSPSPSIKPDREQQDKIRYSNNSATISHANKKRGMEPWQKATLILVGMFLLATTGYLVCPHFTGTYQASNGDSQNALLKLRLQRDGNDIKSNHYALEDLEKWKNEYQSFLKSGRVDSTNLVIDSTNLVIINNNQKIIDTLIRCFEDASRTFELIKTFIQQPFGQGKQQAEELLTRIEELSLSPCSNLFNKEQNDSKKILEKIIAIERDIGTYRNGSVSGRDRPEAQARLRKLAQDTTLSAPRRESLKKY